MWVGIKFICSLEIRTKPEPILFFITQSIWVSSPNNLINRIWDGAQSMRSVGYWNHAIYPKLARAKPQDVEQGTIQESQLLCNYAPCDEVSDLQGSRVCSRLRTWEIHNKFQIYFVLITWANHFKPHRPTQKVYTAVLSCLIGVVNQQLNISILLNNYII